MLMLFQIKKHKKGYSECGNDSLTIKVGNLLK
jgi:hypothetical protein